MSEHTRVSISDAADATDNSHVAQDSSKPRLPNKQIDHAAESGDGHQAAADERTGAKPSEQEYGGQAGLDPTRYGDWEKKGRVTDF